MYKWFCENIFDFNEVIAWLIYLFVRYGLPVSILIGGYLIAKHLVQINVYI